MCVMCYLFVLYIEFVPTFCERFIDDQRFSRLSRYCVDVNQVVGKFMFLVFIVGVGISCLHQSSLGHVMVLVPSKLHPLWYSPILSLLFLVSAVAAGFPTVIVTILLACWAFALRPPTHMLAALAKIVALLLAVYLAIKIGDLLIRGSYVHLADYDLQSLMFMIEIGLGVALPLVLLISRRIRESPTWLGVACGLVMLGVVLNRANVYWIGYHPARATGMYFPSLTEWMVAAGSAAALVFCWRAIAIQFPVLSLPVELVVRAGRRLETRRVDGTTNKGRNAAVRRCPTEKMGAVACATSSEHCGD